MSFVSERYFYYICCLEFLPPRRMARASLVSRLSFSSDPPPFRLWEWIREYTPFAWVCMYIGIPPQRPHKRRIDQVPMGGQVALLKYKLISAVDHNPKIRVTKSSRPFGWTLGHACGETTLKHGRSGSQPNPPGAAGQAVGVEVETGRRTRRR